MFLWVRLVVSMLENAYTVEKMLRALEEIPRGLEDVLVAGVLTYLDLLTLTIATTRSSSASRH